MTDITDLVNALFKPTRQIGPYSASLPDGVQSFDPFSADVTIEEIPIDELVLTSHPVEQGASITDHAFKKPSALILKLGWTNSNISGLANMLSSAADAVTGSGEGGFSRVKEIYDRLLAIQLARVPMYIYTGKRIYRNMMIKSLTAPTNVKTEHALIVTMILEEILIARTTAVSSTDASVQADPQATQSTQNSGNKAAQITTYSLKPNSWDVDKLIGVKGG